MQILAIAVAIIIGLVGAKTVEQAIEIGQMPKMIYVNPNIDLPAFNKNQDLSKKEYLPLVALYRNGQFFCSGSVISNDYVLTAAHCLMEYGGMFPTMTLEKITVTSVPSEKDESVLEKPGVAAALNNRADYALIKGDFQQFTKFKVLAEPKDVAISGENKVAACGFPYGAHEICYVMQSPAITYYDHIFYVGRLYAGMSGGPVLDLNRGGVFAVNSAVSNGGVVVAPLVGLFESLNIEVEEE